VEVVLSERDVANLKPGDEVLVASKAFNPIVVKLKETWQEPGEEPPPV